MIDTFSKELSYNSETAIFNKQFNKQVLPL